MCRNYDVLINLTQTKTDPHRINRIIYQLSQFTFYALVSYVNLLKVMTPVKNDSTQHLKKNGNFLKTLSIQKNHFLINFVDLYFSEF